MWKLNCGCNPPSYDYIEFNIPDIKKPDNSSPVLLQNKFDHTGELKNKIVCDYFNIIDKLECGIQPELADLLEEISLIEINQYFSNIIFGKDTIIYGDKIDTDMIIYTTFFGGSSEPNLQSINNLHKGNNLTFTDNINNVYYYIVTPYNLKSVETPFESLLDESNPNRFIEIETKSIDGILYHVWRFSLDSGLVFQQNINVTLEK